MAGLGTYVTRSHCNPDLDSSGAAGADALSLASSGCKKGITVTIASSSLPTDMSTKPPSSSPPLLPQQQNETTTSPQTGDFDRLQFVNYAIICAAAVPVYFGLFYDLAAPRCSNLFASLSLSYCISLVWWRASQGLSTILTRPRSKSFMPLATILVGTWIIGILPFIDGLITSHGLMPQYENGLT